jgi:hypothetical protein
MSCNLLPAKIQRQQLLAFRRRQWLAAIGICCVLTLIWTALAWQERAVEERAAEEFRRESRFVTYLNEQVDALRRQNRTLAHREALFVRLESPIRPLGLLGLCGQIAQSCQGIVVERLESVERPDPNKKPATNPGQTPVLVSIQLQAASSLPVAQFVLGLRERELFRNVELKTGGRIAAASTALASYVVECWF